MESLTSFADTGLGGRGDAGTRRRTGRDEGEEMGGGWRAGGAPAAALLYVGLTSQFPAGGRGVRAWNKEENGLLWGMRAMKKGVVQHQRQSQPAAAHCCG
jgi:hypothetical protein